MSFNRNVLFPHYAFWECQRTPRIIAASLDHAMWKSPSRRLISMTAFELFRRTQVERPKALRSNVTFTGAGVLSSRHQEAMLRVSTKGHTHSSQWDRGRSQDLANRFERHARARLTAQSQALWHKRSNPAKCCSCFKKPQFILVYRLTSWEGTASCPLPLSFNPQISHELLQQIVTRGECRIQEAQTFDLKSSLRPRSYFQTSTTRQGSFSVPSTGQCNAVMSLNQRSWVMTTAQSNSSAFSRSYANVSTSRSLVGSSRSKRFPPCFKVSARYEPWLRVHHRKRTPAGFCWSAPLETKAQETLPSTLKAFQHCPL